MSYGSAGNGTTMHIAAEQLNASAGTKITHVPYRGIAPALNDIMGKHIDFLNGDITVLYPLVKQGTIRALAVAGNERSKLLPDVPTAGEAGFKNVYMENWYGALVPAATPPDVVAKLEAAIMDVLKTRPCGRRFRRTASTARRTRRPSARRSRRTSPTGARR